ncbi:MAG TPA: response regulator [Flavisolibacter sp.]|jgi:two-component system chemotaxis response regulator CheY|nr:response regulator [Flavisolibacter sp.]
MNQLRQPIRSIAIIDDDEDDFELVSEAIQEISPDITVQYIRCCADAYRYEGHHFDLVLLDINMPECDGFGWLKAIREKGHTDLPVIMYTNSLSPAHISRAYEEGATLYFSKPESFTSLISGMRRLIQLDWSSPFHITSQYRYEGGYKTFA